ncbi:hypothetical protein FE257_008484 [Aspergillus nanangensis]|uniref:Uncharacterized protein n=1 Tax=Aspergillus nanangensis TaxID=2582783 RepID=A0AAD4GUL0_ASPNN|nr:hypothetical protein FE257_008484 [Aspergillus nanangensis]
MQSEWGYDKPITFNNAATNSFQVLHQTIITNRIIHHNGQSRANVNIDEISTSDLRADYIDPCTQPAHYEELVTYLMGQVFQSE